MVSGHTQSNDRARERVAGVRDTLLAHGLALPAERIVETEFSIRRGREALATLLAADTGITAVICGNDILAMGVLIEAGSRGIRVPQDLSVTGFDDIDLAREWSPALTTMRLPVAQIGRRAAERMLARIEGSGVSLTEEVQVELIERESTARAPMPRPTEPATSRRRPSAPR